MDGWHELARPGRAAATIDSAGGTTPSHIVSSAVRRAQMGDRRAFAFLYARFADNVYGYARSIVHDHHEAEDIAQQVFAKLIRVIGKYQERDVPFLAWLLRVTRNVAVDHLRKRQMLPVEQVTVVDSGQAQTSEAQPIRELKEALASLPRAQREVLVMRHVGGLTPPEIAQRTGRSEGSVHGLHHRGRKALRIELVERGLKPATTDRPVEPTT